MFKRLIAEMLTETRVGSLARWTLEATHSSGAAPDRLKALLDMPFNATVALPDGCSLRLHCANSEDEVVHPLHWRGFQGYEPETTSLFYRLSAGSRCVLDVGAHVGYYALLAATANAQARVFAFEPVPQIQDRLRANVKLNGFNHVHCEPLAASDKDGSVEFYVPPGLSPTSASALKGFRPAEYSLKVSATRLDTFVKSRQLSKIDLVKMDTEGTEHLVLEGMREILAEQAPLIISEALHGRNEAEQQSILEDHGYRWYWLTDQGPVHRERIVGDPTYRFRNYLYLQPDRPDLPTLLPNDVRQALGL